MINGEPTDGFGGMEAGIEGFFFLQRQFKPGCINPFCAGDDVVGPCKGLGLGEERWCCVKAVGKGDAVKPSGR